MTFVLSKLFWFVVTPGNLLLLVLLFGLLATFVWPRFGRFVVGAGILAMLIVALLPLELLLIRPLEDRFPPRQPPAQVDGIVVLGGPLMQDISFHRGQPSLTSAAERMTEFVRLARAYPDAHLVFSGGDGFMLGDAPMSEADVARQLFGDLGLDTARITFEGRSRNTFENARNAFALVKPQPGETWLLITSALHMPRALGVFRSAGWPIQPFPVDYLTDGEHDFGLRFNLTQGLNGLHAGLHEWIGLVAYRWLGRTDRLLPSET